MSHLNSRSNVPRPVAPASIRPQPGATDILPAHWLDMGDWQTEVDDLGPDFSVGGYRWSVGVDGGDIVIITAGLNASRYDPVANTYCCVVSDGGLTNHPDGPAAQVGDIIYKIGGGLGGGDGVKVTGYDVSTDTWAAYADYPQTVTSNLACASGGLVYSFGGGVAGFTPNGGDAFVYDPGTDTWSAITSVPSDIFEIGFAVKLDDDTILMYGAQGGGLYGGYIYDPVGDSYTAIADSARGNTWPYGSAVVLDGNVYAATGDTSTSYADAYDPDSDTWDLTAIDAITFRNPQDSPFSRIARDAAVVNGVGYFLWDSNDTFSHMMRLAL